MRGNDEDGEVNEKVHCRQEFDICTFSGLIVRE